MLEFLKDYEKFRAEIRQVKTETFTELKGLLDDNERLKRQLSEKDAKHERDIMTLSHSLQLERERFALETERLIAKTKGDLYGERERFLEKNFADLRDTMQAQHSATKDILSLVVTRLPSVNLLQEPALKVRLEDAQTDSHRALPTGRADGKPSTK